MSDGFTCTKKKSFYHFFYYRYEVKRPHLSAEMLVGHEYALFMSPKLVLLFFNVKRQECLLAFLDGR